MECVIGVSKTFNSSKKQRGSEKHRKYYFCYKFDLESGKFQRIRVSSVKAFYYKITFIFGLKAKKVTNVYCKDCNVTFDCVVNFWNRSLDCPTC